jgi:hypothetical protein
MDRRTQGQRIGWRGSLIFPSAYLDKAETGVVATLVGVQADALAGTLSAAGSAFAEITGVQAQAIAGSLSAAGDGVASLTGVSATARAGALAASATEDAVAVLAGVQIFASAGWLIASAGVPQQQFGGFQMRRSAFPVNVNLRGVTARATAGRMAARNVNRATATGSSSITSAGRITAVGTASAQIKRAGATADAGRVAAVGTWPITDEELLYALLYQAA